MAESKSSGFHTVMFPWFAFGHFIPFLHLSNKLAEKGNKITFLLPTKAGNQLQNLNLHPDLISFHPLTIPHVDGLPDGAETASDIPRSLNNLIAIALDRTRDQVEAVIKATKPNLVIFDAAYWMPEITKPLGIKCVEHSVGSPAFISFALVPARNVPKDKPPTEAELVVPPAGYLSKTLVLRRHEARMLSFIYRPFGEEISFYERLTTGMKQCDAISVSTCYEIEGEFCEYIGSQYNKPVFLTGPVLPEPAKTPLEERWAKWLSGFPSNSVVYCAFGSQNYLEKNQFRELLLGLELTGLPFFVALKPPTGTSTVEEAIPEGFEERIKGRGVVYGGWVQQVPILEHSSVGCFVSHCGFGSMWESLMSNCQIVLVPNFVDHIFNTRLLVEDLKVAFEVEREEDGWFSKESLCKAIKSVMDKDSEFGNTLKKNHLICKEKLGRPGLVSGYIDKFVENMQELVK